MQDEAVKNIYDGIIYCFNKHIIFKNHSYLSIDDNNDFEISQDLQKYELKAPTVIKKKTEELSKI